MQTTYSSHEVSEKQFYKAEHIISYMCWSTDVKQEIFQAGVKRPLNHPWHFFLHILNKHVHNANTVTIILWEQQCYMLPGCHKLEKQSCAPLRAFPVPPSPSWSQQGEYYQLVGQRRTAVCSDNEGGLSHCRYWTFYEAFIQSALHRGWLGHTMEEPFVLCVGTANCFCCTAWSW